MTLRVRVALAWGVTIAVLAVLFWRVPFGIVLDQVRSAPGWTVPSALIFIALIYLADSFATWATFARLAIPASFTELLVARGASYLLASVNYAAGQGGLVYFVSRAGNVTVGRAGVATLISAFANMLLLLVLATAGLALSDEYPPVWRTLLAGAWGAVAVYAALVALKPRALRRFSVVQGLLDVGIGGHLWAGLVRTPHVVALTLFSIAMLRAFGVAVPLGAAFAGLPIVWIISILPISIRGLGTAQAAMVLLFKRFSTATDANSQEAAVLASSLTAFALMAVTQGLAGLVCVRTHLGREMGPGSARR